MNGFQLILSYFSTAPISDYIFYLAMFIVAILSKFFYKKRELLVNSIAAIGMLGTFFGICIGLQNFDSNDLTNSLPILLSGMKTAFYTSLVGTGGSIFLKIIYGLKGTKLEPAEQEFFEHNKILREQNNQIIALMKEQILETKNLKDLQINNFNTMKKNQMNNISQIEKLNSTFENFKNSMAQKNAEAISEAVSICIERLNKKMIEQLGENFNKFNEGMKKLIDWQENYSNIIETTNTKQQEVLKSFEVLTSKIKDLYTSSNNFMENSAKITEMANTLNEAMDYNSQVIEKVNLSLGYVVSSNEDLVKFIALLKQTYTLTENNYNEFSGLLSKISTDIEMFSNNLKAFNKTSKETYENYTENITNQFTAISQNIEKFSDNMNKECSKAIGIYENYTKNIANQFSTISQNIGKLSDNLKEEYSKSINKSIIELESISKQLEKTTNSHIQQIDTELGKVLTASLRILGEELAALSKKFVDDYTPLTEKLKEIIEISKKVR